MWSASAWNCEHTLTEHTFAVRALVVHAGKLLSGSWDQTVKVWDPATWQCERTITGGLGSTVCSLHIHGNRLLVGLINGEIQVRNVETGEAVRTLDGHANLVTSLTTLQDKLVSGSFDRLIKVWC